MRLSNYFGGAVQFSRRIQSTPKRNNNGNQYLNNGNNRPQRSQHHGTLLQDRK